MAVSFSQPVQSGGAVKASLTKSLGGTQVQQPAQPQGDPYLQMLQDGTAASSTKTAPPDLPVFADPGYAIFKANTNFQHDLTNIGMNTAVSQAGIDANNQLAALPEEQRKAEDQIGTSAADRGVGRFAGTALQYGQESGDIANKRAGILATYANTTGDAVAKANAAQQDLGVKGAPQAVTTASNIATKGV